MTSVRFDTNFKNLWTTIRKTSVAQTKWVYISNLSISNKSLWVNFDRICCTEPFVLVLRQNWPSCCSLSSKKKWQDYVSLPGLRYLEQKQLEYEHMRERKKKREQWKQRITDWEILLSKGRLYQQLSSTVECLVSTADRKLQTVFSPLDFDWLKAFDLEA